MTDQYIGEIRICSFNFAPNGWAICAGQLLPISQYTALFSILGTTYGGNGTTNFALPNLQGRVPVGFGQGPGLEEVVEGEESGESSVTLLQANMPSHNHVLFREKTKGNTNNKTSAPATTSYLSSIDDFKHNVTLNNVLVGGTPNTFLAPQTIGLAGGSQPHDNMQPYLVLNYCIALTGIFPSRS